MRNVNNFVGGRKINRMTLDELIAEYDKLSGDNEVLETFKEQYETQFSGDDDEALTFKDFVAICLALDSIDGNKKFMGKSPVELANKIAKTNGNVDGYFYTINQMKFNKNKQKSILTNGVDFNGAFYEQGVYEGCPNGCFFVKLGDHLECPICGRNTKGFNLTDKQLEFIEKAATEQGLLKDTKAFGKMSITREKANQIIESAEEEYANAEASDSKYRDLIMEECRTAKYEALILSGSFAPALLSEAETEEDKTAIVKAYYNIVNNRGNYFNYNVGHDYMTANEEINNSVYLMKLKRKR